MSHRYLLVTAALIQTSRLRSEVLHTMAIILFFFKVDIKTPRQMCKGLCLLSIVSVPTCLVQSKTELLLLPHFY